MASVSWTATTGGNWNSPGSWSNGVVPQTGDDVSINSANSITVTYSTGTLRLDSLFTGGTDTLDITGGMLGAGANGYRFLGDLQIGGGTLRLAAGGQYGGSIDNTLTQTGGSLVFVNDATIQDATLDQTGGTITINHGVLNDQDQSGTIAGTVTGAGMLEFSSNNNGTTVLAATAVLSTGAVAVDQGTLFLQENFTYANNFTLLGTLDLNGHAAMLSGNDALDGDVNGGSVTLSGTGHLNGLTLDNGAALSIAGTINQTGSVQLGGNTGTGQMSIGRGDLLRITGNDSISQGNSAGTLINAGTIEKTGGGFVSGAAIISTTVVSTGIIDAAVGTIDFSGPGGGAESTITGTIEGAGTVQFSNGDYILGSSGPGLTLASHRLLINGSTSSTNITIASALSYAGTWEQDGGLVLLSNSLALSGTTDLASGELKGTATITDSGKLLTLGSGVQLEGNLSFILGGAVDQTGSINFGDISDSVDQATLTAGNTWTIENGSSINGNFGTITNQGTFVKSNGLQDSSVASNLFNTGTMLVESGTLSLSGQGTLGGTIGGSGVLEISGQFAFASGVSLGVGELILDSQGNDIQATLGGNLTYANVYAQEGGTLALAGNTLTLNGSTSLDAGAFLGNGAVQVNGAAVINGVSLSEGGLLQFNGATEQIGSITLTGGSTAPTLSIGAKGVYTIDNGLSIGGSNDSVVGTVTVAGTLDAGGANTSTIAASVQDNGTIAISHGQMTFLGALSGSGAVSLTAGGNLYLDNSFNTSTGVTFGAGGGLLTLQDPGAYSGTIGGFGAGDAVELNGFAFQGGTLTTLAVSGDLVTINEVNGPSVTLTFSTSQTASSLFLATGPHGGLALVHS